MSWIFEIHIPVLISHEMIHYELVHHIHHTRVLTCWLSVMYISIIYLYAQIFDDGKLETNESNRRPTEFLIRSNSIYLSST